MAKLPTVADVAREARVSRQTVSNVLNSPAIVAEPTRERVREVISRLGYRPHAAARRLRTRKSSSIGIRLEQVGDGISGSVLDAFLHALTEGADRRDMRILLYTASDADDEIAQLTRLRDGADVDAVVLTSTTHDDPRTNWLIENDVPFATFGRPWEIDDMDDPAHPWVDIDGRAGVHEATTHLIDRGARRIGFIGWPSPSGAGDDRRRGWLDAMSAAELDVAGRSVEVEEGVPQGSSAATRLISDGVDAIVCASDSLALGAVMSARATGRADLAVVGFDDTPVASAIGLSSVRQPLDEAAAGILELLFGVSGSDIVPRADAAALPRHRLLTPRFVGRASTDLLRAPAR